MLAPSSNIKQARRPGNMPGAAPIDNFVTGQSLCMKNTALCALVSSFANNRSSVSVVAHGNSLSGAPERHQIR
jgi:hypothetical protein